MKFRKIREYKIWVKGNVKRMDFFRYITEKNITNLYLLFISYKVSADAANLVYQLLWVALPVVLRLLYRIVEKNENDENDEKTWIERWKTWCSKKIKFLW